ncbi:TPA: radical SAM protein [Candidatus Woesearchaeota archaeon]|nr:radical SAM protein [Candidatus Woesearchaeota archaeon]
MDADGHNDGKENSGNAARISFQDIRFGRLPSGDVRATFLTRYIFDIPADDLRERIGEFSIEDGALVFPGVDENRAWKRFDPLLDEGFRGLRHLLYDKPAVYIHQNSSIPLIGTNEFGIMDRGSNILEVKPLTGCNFQCPYCSVDEGKNDKTHDYIVECDYLVQEAAKLAAKKAHPVEFNIGPQGEPLLYPRTIELVRGLKSIPNCAVISINTNGSLLTTQLIDDLAAAGLTRINLSLNALTQDAADRLAGKKYPLEKTLRMVEYCRGKIAVLIAPTVVPGFNDDEIDGLVQLSTTIEKRGFPTIGLQNYLEYPKGRAPAKAREFPDFFAMLKPIEEKYGVNLTEMRKGDFAIFDEPEPPKPFFKNDIVRMRVMLPARYKNEIVAVAQGRCITVVGKDAHLLPIGKDIKARIIRDKHNIFKAAI